MWRAAFFVLAGAGWDAVSVLAREGGDLQLALLVARLLDASASTGVTGGVTGGGGLHARLVKEQLIPLAAADADPGAAALVAWLESDHGAGGGSSATTTTTTAAAAAAAASAAVALLRRFAPQHLLQCSQQDSTGDPERLLQAGGEAAAQQQQQQPTHGAAANVGGLQALSLSSLTPPPPPPAALGQHVPLALHWLLRTGVPALAGVTVPGWVVPAVQALALRVARCAEVAGLPLAAAEALAVADRLLPSPNACGSAGIISEESSSSGNGALLLGQLLGMMWPRFGCSTGRLPGATSSHVVNPAPGAGERMV